MCSNGSSKVLRSTAGARKRLTHSKNTQSSNSSVLSRNNNLTNGVNAHIDTGETSNLSINSSTRGNKKVPLRSQIVTIDNVDSNDSHTH